MEVIAKGLIAVITNYAVHFGSARVYDLFCVPHSVSEILHTIVTTSSPVCVVTLGTMQMTQNNYVTLLTTTLASHIINALKV